MNHWELRQQADNVSIVGSLNNQKSLSYWRIIESRGQYSHAAHKEEK